MQEKPAFSWRAGFFMENAMPGGRPETELSDLPSDWKEQMRTLAKAGKSELATRVTLGIGKTVWYRLKEENEQFRETVSECLGLCQLWWEDVGQQGMFMGGKDNPFNATVYTFNMSNRFGWSMKNESKTDVTTNGKDVGLPMHSFVNTDGE